MRKIIDFHAHLGDIFHENKNITFKTGIKKSKYDDAFTSVEKVDYTIPLMVKDDDYFRKLIVSGQQRAWEWTLENLSHDMDESGISYIVLLPILPNTSFEEYLAASKLDPRIIPFSSADFTLPIREMAAKLKKDIAKGAKGLKLHPNIQNQSMHSEKSYAAIDVFGQANLPILSHVGDNPYYLPESPYSAITNPAYGAWDNFFKLAHKFPDYNLVAAHCLSDPEKIAEGTKGCKNVYVDSTMASADQIRRGVKLLGADRILYGSDVPFADFDTPVRVMEAAFAKEPEIAEMTFYKNAARLMHLK